MRHRARLGMSRAGLLDVRRIRGAVRQQVQHMHGQLRLAFLLELRGLLDDVRRVGDRGKDRRTYVGGGCRVQAGGVAIPSSVLRTPDIADDVVESTVTLLQPLMREPVFRIADVVHDAFEIHAAIHAIDDFLPQPAQNFCGQQQAFADLRFIGNGVAEFGNENAGGRA